MDIGKIKTVAGAFLLSTMLNTQSVNAQESPHHNDYKHMIDCHLTDGGEVTSKFLGDLDSKIHGYSENLYEMTPEQREPYLKAIIDNNKSHPPQFLRAMFEGPYRQYAALETEEERVDFLSERLERFHHMKPDDLSSLAASCE